MRVLLFANGDIADIDPVRHYARSADLVVCADGGSRHAYALGLRPDVVIGDMD